MSNKQEEQSKNPEICVTPIEVTDRGKGITNPTKGTKALEILQGPENVIDIKFDFHDVWKDENGKIFAQRENGEMVSLSKTGSQVKKILQQKGIKTQKANKKEKSQGEEK